MTYDNWIPITKKLPDNTGRYLITYLGYDGVERISTTDFIYEIHLYNWEYIGMYKIIAWQELPKPYKQ